MSRLLAHPAAAAFQRGRQLAAQRQMAAARECFAEAASADHPEALCWLAITQHHGLGTRADPPAAMPLYQRAAALGSAEAGIRLAVSRLHGRWLPLQIDALLAELAPAIALGHPQLRELLAMQGVAVGARLDTEQAQARLCDLLLEPVPALLPLSAGGRLIGVAEEVLRPAECQRLIACARPALRPAMVINPQTSQMVPDPSRSNRSAPLGTGAPDLVLALSEWRIARVADLPLAHAEYTAALCYQPGEEYRPHRDYLHPSAHPEQFAPGAPGQRIRTAFAYLNAVDAGGATEFPLLDLQIKPVPGRVVVFDNVRADGEPDPQTLHAGRPVERGEKWLATLWLRHGPLRVA